MKFRQDSHKQRDPQAPVKLRYIARGTFQDGSAYIRFPQEKVARHVLFLRYADGSGGMAYQGQLAKFYPAGSFDALLVKAMFKMVDSGEVPKLTDAPAFP